MKTPIASTFIFVDRRKTGRGKSLNNRQKLLDRIKDTIRSSKPIDIDQGGVKATGGSAHRTLANPIKIARSALHEPTFHYDPLSGSRQIVFIGNDRWERGDDFPVDDGSGNGSGKGGKGKGNGPGAGPGEDGEDDFIVNISKSEFFDVYFGDCELPDLKETSEKVLPEATWKPAGYQKEGNAAQLSVIRSYRNSIGRRKALSGQDRRELKELEEELLQLDDLLASNPLNAVANARFKEIEERLIVLRRKLGAIPFFEKMDLRYKKSERIQIRSADAVFVMLMDISGSMDENKKMLARKFFSLQYAFIQRLYPNTDLVFIAHTDKAEEMDEENFFSTRKSGGTIVSCALELANAIIKERYDPEQTNIYLSYAGDGDNWDQDNARVGQILVEEGLLSKVRHAVYAQVGHSFAASYGTDSLWTVVKHTAASNPKLHMIKIQDENDVFTGFKTIYGKKKAAKK